MWRVTGPLWALPPSPSLEAACMADNLLRCAPGSVCLLKAACVADKNVSPSAGKSGSLEAACVAGKSVEVLACERLLEAPCVASNSP